MKLVDLLARRDAAALAFEAAQATYQRTLSGVAYREVEAARVARREASDACDNYPPSPTADLVLKLLGYKQVTK